MNAAAPQSTVRALLALSAPWLGRWRTRLGILLMLSLTAMQVVMAVAYNLWNAALFDALERRDVAALWHAVGLFALLIFAILLSNAAQLAAKRGLVLSWRRALTERLLATWLAEGRHWRLGQIADGPDNPDGRIAEDIRVATEHGVELVSSIFYSSALLAAFFGILWSLSGTVEILGIPVPGHIVWLAVLYAAGGALAAFALGRPLTLATEARQHAEADLRYALAQAREHDEGMALARGEPVARGGLAERFETLARTWHRQTWGLRNLMGFQSAYVTVAPIFPLLVAAPRYLAGQLTLGGLMQIAQGFQQAVAALSWPVENTARLAEWHASAERVLALADAVDQAEGQTARLELRTEGEALVLAGVTLRLPDGSALAAPIDTSIPPGALLEVSGHARGVEALYLAIAGLWRWGDGVLSMPSPLRVAALPRRPWLPAVALSRLLTPTGGAPREALVAALEGVGLAPLATRLDETTDWENALDEPDRMRLGFARLLLARPDVALIADVASVLDEGELRRLIGILTRAIPQAIVLATENGSLHFPARLELKPALDVPRGPAARATARQRDFLLVDWLRRGFGHREN
jgi:putative ATP-binding cassette transporter